MLLLIIDTSGKNGFVGLARSSEDAQVDNTEVIEEIPLAGGTFSAQLVPQISGLLEKYGFRKTDIGAFIVVSGPGSFTGLRVGLAAIKALAEILQKPIVPVSLLEVMAGSVVWAAGNDGTTVPFAVALDAGRNEVFVGQFEQAFLGKRLASLQCRKQSLIPLGQLASLLDNNASHWISTPDAHVYDSLKQKLGSADLSIHLENRPRSIEIANMGYIRLRERQTVTPELLDANYMRHSDAEIFPKPTA